MPSWDTSGNSNTDPPADFLGTADNQPLVLKTNNVERIRVNSAGQMGVGTATPAALLHVTPAAGGTMAFPYEAVVSETPGDNKVGIYTSQATFSGAGSAITLGDIRATNANHRFPGFEIQNINGNTPANSYLRFNYLERNPAGQVSNPNPDLVRILGNGNVGVGATVPAARLSVSANIGDQIVGTAASTTFRTTSPVPGHNLGDNTALASFGSNLEGNNVSLGVRIYRVAPPGESDSNGWQSCRLVLSMDVDDTPIAGGAIVLDPSGDVYIGDKLGNGLRFPDGTRQTTATLQGPPGPPGPQGPPGSGSGVAIPPQIVLTTNNGGAGFIALRGPGGFQTVQLSSVSGSPNNGAISVTDAVGAAAGVAKISLTVDAAGNGVITANTKNFRVPHSTLSDTDIVYACIEGPEAAAYVRGTSHLIDGRAEVILPDHFVEVVVLAGMTVSLTPLSAGSRGLAVTEKRKDKITVNELSGGRGSYEFDWEVKAVRKTHENYEVLRPRSEIALARIGSAS